MPGVKIPVHFKPVKPGSYEWLRRAVRPAALQDEAYMLVLPEAEYREVVALKQAPFEQRLAELFNSIRKLTERWRTPVRAATAKPY